VVPRGDNIGNSSIGRQYCVRRHAVWIDETTRLWLQRTYNQCTVRQTYMTSRRLTWQTDRQTDWLTVLPDMLWWERERWKRRRHDARITEMIVIMTVNSFNCHSVMQRTRLYRANVDDAHTVQYCTEYNECSLIISLWELISVSSMITQDYTRYVSLIDSCSTEHVYRPIRRRL